MSRSGAGYPNPPPIPPVVPRPASAIKKATPRLQVSNPGEQWTQTAGIGFITGSTMIPLRFPDAYLGFVADDLFNCIYIDYDCVAVDDGWIVPEFCTLYLAEQMPAVFTNSLSFTNALPRPTLFGTGFPPVVGNYPLWDQWDWSVKDFGFQPIIQRANGSGSFTLPISITLPDRKVFALQGTRLFRFALLAMWMYRKDNHVSLPILQNPHFTFRTWFDDAKLTLEDNR